MVRKIIEIQQEKCSGCGLCEKACHEGAIEIIAGKAHLLREDYCDGLGDCLPACPTGAITIQEREAADYDEAAVKANTLSKESESGKLAAHDEAGHKTQAIHTEGCPGAAAYSLKRTAAEMAPAPEAAKPPSQLNQWPVQIKLVPINAPYFNEAHLLVSADCAAYAYADFHNTFMRNKVTLIGCPKLDNEDYSVKLTAIIKSNPIKSITVVRMEVPCCGGIESAVKTALTNSGKMIPWQVITLTTDGHILEN